MFDIGTVENIIMLLSVVAALLICLFRFIDVPRRGFLLLCVYFLAHILSDYYWTVYSLVMYNYPNVSEVIAYFGWNLGYVVLLITVLHMRDPDSKRYFNPLMFIPIPLNIYQFFLYIRFGGFFNNLWSGVFVTSVIVVCLQSLLWYYKKRHVGAHFPYFHLFVLIYSALGYGMWTASCFDWPSPSRDPYYYCAFISYAFFVALPWAMGKDYELRGLVSAEKSTEEIRFQGRIEAAVSLILLGVCTGGYFFAAWMKRSLNVAEGGDEVYDMIAIMLFVLSCFLDILILSILYVVALRYRTMKLDIQTSGSNRRRRLNLAITLLITLALMIFAVVYNSSLYYDVSVNRIIETADEKVAETAAELTNYLTMAESTLKVTSDTVDIMIRENEPPDKIEKFIVCETENQKSEFDENFTGIYALINGRYMDGLGWVPEDDYDPTERDWYKEAVDAGGRTVIVSPYVDAQTNSVVITICRMLSDSVEGNRNIVALDVIVNHIQESTSNTDIGGKGYAIVVNEDGFIIAHGHPENNGKNIEDIFGKGIFERVREEGDVSDVEIDGIEYNLFSSRVMDQWYVIFAVSRSELLGDVYSQIMVNIIVSFVIFALIFVFYYLGYKNEQAYSKKMEEMTVSRQKQDYEAQVLRLEKVAADEANKAKSDFLADMSHEIRTPINAILGMNEMILRETEEEGTAEYAKNIRTSGRNLLSLINSILDFSKIEDGKMEISPVRYSIRNVITYLINSIRERIDSKGLELVCRIDPEIPAELYGDDVRIEQIILNLLTNAVKYTDEGTVTLTVSEKSRENGKVLIYVEVRDTGIGIKDSDMGRLFESFERLDLGRNRTIEGTGLGIPITTKLLDLMHSELQVESEYGIGSAFSFELWQKIEKDIPVGEFKISESNEAFDREYTEAFQAEDARILVVDDMNLNLMVVKNLLKKTHIKTDTALSGKEAVRMCEENPYDVILLDQRMPEMDGTQTLAAIRAIGNKKNADTPVICLTADAIRGARERYMAEGFTDYLTKPVEGPELERMLLEYLPEEKITKKDEIKDDPATDDPAFDELKKAGFDTASGIRFCNSDPEFYKEVLGEFALEHDSKIKKLNDFYDNNNWEEYSILIHSVKSAAKTIGADKLSGMAA
ncbi:MAG: response regulator, partial [Lachnospiraceae bacterium]|nr:response regulator [Lachnospiraceae bacterium]